MSTGAEDRSPGQVICSSSGTLHGADLGHGSAQARPRATYQLAGLSDHVGRRVLALAHLHHLDEAGRLAARSLEHLAGLFLGHGPRRVPRLSLGEVNQLGDVRADEVVLLRPSDRPDKRALDLHQR